MKFKKGDIVMVVDPALDWPEKYRKNAFGVCGVVVSTGYTLGVEHIQVYDGCAHYKPGGFFYHPEALEKLPAMNVGCK